MAAHDTISDMLTRIRNANLARHQTTEVPSTKLTRSIAKVLKDEGFIADFAEAGGGIKRNLMISLKPTGKEKHLIIFRIRTIPITLADKFPEEWDCYQHWMRDILEAHPILFKKYKSQQVAMLITCWRLLCFGRAIGWAIASRQIKKMIVQRRDSA